MISGSAFASLNGNQVYAICDGGVAIKGILNYVQANNSVQIGVDTYVSQEAIIYLSGVDFPDSLSTTPDNSDAISGLAESVSNLSLALTEDIRWIIMTVAAIGFAMMAK